jgi:hypothetical protein
MCELLATGELSLGKVADKFRVSPGAVWTIWAGKTWRHLDVPRRST